MSNTATDFKIEAVSQASTRTIIIFYFNATNNKRLTYEHHHMPKEAGYEHVDFDELEKIIGEIYKCHAVIYGVQFGTSLIAEFLVNDEPVTLSKIIAHEGLFCYVGGNILDRNALLKYCKNDIAKLAREFPSDKEYIHIVGGILPFEKDKHQIIKRPKISAIVR